MPAQVRFLLKALAAAMRNREPAIRERVQALRTTYPQLTNDELARRLIRTTRRRVTATAAASGALALAPGLGSLLAILPSASQSLYALEQETELVLAIAILYGHELESSDARLLEALIVVGIAGGAVKLRENVLVAGGQRITVEAFRRLPSSFLSRSGGHVLRLVMARIGTTGLANRAARVAPLAVGVAAGAGFDWVAVTGLGKAAVAYYGPGGPAARTPRLTGAQNPGDVEVGR
jgi:hypothetical protein